MSKGAILGDAGGRDHAWADNTPFDLVPLNPARVKSNVQTVLVGWHPFWPYLTRLGACS